MPGRKLSEIQIPEGTPEGLSGVIFVQDQMRTVLAGMQIQVGEATTALAKLQEASERRQVESGEHGQQLSELRKLIQGGNGERSLITRMAIVEHTQQTMLEDMKEHRIAVEGKLEQILQRSEEARRQELDRREVEEREARARRTQIGLAIAAGAISILTCLLTLLVGLLRHP